MTIDTPTLRTVRQRINRRAALGKQLIDQQKPYPKPRAPKSETRGKRDIAQSMEWYGPNIFYEAHDYHSTPDHSGGDRPPSHFTQ